MFLGKHQPVGGYVDSVPMYQGMSEGAMGMADASGYAAGGRGGYEVGGYVGPGMAETLHASHSEYDMPPGCAPRHYEYSEFDLDIEPSPRQKIHVVRKGDTVFKIAQKHGLDWRELAGYNHLPNPDLIYPGQRLVIPPRY